MDIAENVVNVCWDWRADAITGRYTLCVISFS